MVGYSICSSGSELNILKCTVLKSRFPCWGRSTSPSDGRRPKHAFLREKSYTNLHIRRCTRVEWKLLGEGHHPSMFALYRAGGKAQMARLRPGPQRVPKVRAYLQCTEERESLHGRVAAPAPARSADLSMPLLNIVPDILQ